MEVATISISVTIACDVLCSSNLEIPLCDVHMLQTSEHRLASITSKELEEMYVKNDKDVVKFKAGSQAYELSFQGKHAAANDNF